MGNVKMEKQRVAVGLGNWEQLRLQSCRITESPNSQFPEGCRQKGLTHVPKLLLQEADPPDERC